MADRAATTQALPAAAPATSAVLIVLMYTAGHATFGFQPVRNVGDIARFGRFVFSVFAVVQLTVVMAGAAAVRRVQRRAGEGPPDADPAADDRPAKPRAGARQAAGRPAAGRRADRRVVPGVLLCTDAGRRDAAADPVAGGAVPGGGAGGRKLGIAGGVLAGKDVPDAGDQRARGWRCSSGPSRRSTRSSRPVRWRTSPRC